MGKIINIDAFNLLRKENKEILELGDENIIKLSKEEAKEFFIKVIKAIFKALSTLNKNVNGR